MARIRTVKPEFWTDEKIVTMSPLARLLFIGMWNFVDDEGRAAFSPVRIKMQILPGDSCDISALIGELKTNDLITIYIVELKEYYQINGFSKHQKIDKRRPSKIPPPEDSAELPRLSTTDRDQGKGSRIKDRDQGKEDSAVADAPPAEDVEYYRRGKEILGVKAGALLTKLLKSKGSNFALARAALEVASTKTNPTEYIGGCIKADKSKSSGESW